MRQRFINMFKSDEKDVFSESALRRFWALVNPAVAQSHPKSVSAPTQVIDLAQWVRGRAGLKQP